MHGKSVKALPPHIQSALVNTLQWIYMVETWRPKCLKMVPQAAKIARIFCVFLIGLYDHHLMKQLVQHVPKTSLCFVKWFKK